MAGVLVVACVLRMGVTGGADVATVAARGSLLSVIVMTVRVSHDL